MNQELELKLLCETEEGAGSLLRQIKTVAVLDGPKTYSQQDIYFDTMTRDLAKAGISVRYRDRPKGRSIDIKPVLLRPKALMDRPEIVVVLPDGTEPMEMIRTVLEDQLHLHVGETLIPIVTLNTIRSEYSIRGSSFEATLTIDAVTFEHPGKPIPFRFQEVEIEFESGRRNEFETFCISSFRGLKGVTSSRLSKYMRAREALGLGGYTYGPKMPPFKSKDSACQTASKSCHALLKRMFAFEAGSQLGLDLEQLHEMHRTLGKLRSAVRAFSPCLAKKDHKWLVAELEWLGSSLGRTRQLDLHRARRLEWMEILGTEPDRGWTALGDRLDSLRDASRAELLSCLKGERYQAFKLRAELLLASLAQSTARHKKYKTTAEVAVPKIKGAAKALRDALDAWHGRSNLENMQQLGSRAKELLDCLDTFSPMLQDGEKRQKKKQGRRFSAALLGLKAFQGQLGGLQEALVTSELMAELMKGRFRTKADAICAFVIGEVAGLSAGTRQNGLHQVDGFIEQLDPHVTIGQIVKSASRSLPQSSKG